MTDTPVSMEERVSALEQRVSFLEKERPGRRMRPNVTSQSGVCGIDPSCDSKTCPDASIYRYQQGCQGDRCTEINRAYYADYRAKKRNEKNDNMPTSII